MNTPQSDLEELDRALLNCMRRMAKMIPVAADGSRPPHFATADDQDGNVPETQ